MVAPAAGTRQRTMACPARSAASTSRCPNCPNCPACGGCAPPRADARGGSGWPPRPTPGATTSRGPRCSSPGAASTADCPAIRAPCRTTSPTSPISATSRRRWTPSLVHFLALSGTSLDAEDRSYISAVVNHRAAESAADADWSGDVLQVSECSRKDQAAMLATLDRTMVAGQRVEFAGLDQESREAFAAARRRARRLLQHSGRTRGSTAACPA